MSHIILPRIIEIGKGSINKVPNILSNINKSKPLIVTDKTMVTLGYITTLLSILEQANINADVFSETVTEPTVTSIQAGIEKIKKGNFDAIIALGGGSSIDSAKAISVIGKHGGTINQYRFPYKAEKPGLPIIAIPTTAGTGSECTQVTVITDDESDEKILCTGSAYMPVATILDYELTLTIPARVTADTGIDAMTHAIESFVSCKANLYSDSQALAAMQLIGPNLRKVYHNGHDDNAREKMMLGATLAGIAFSNASVALVHGMSRPLGAFFHIPHGLSNAMLLPTVTQFSLNSAEERYAKCARALNFATSSDNDKIACNKLISTLQEINSELAVPTLQEFGVTEQNYFSVIEIMAHQAQASGSPTNNPKVPSLDEIKTLYRQLWN